MPQYIEFFHGRLTGHGAEVYARVPGLPGGGEWSLRGQVRGPECRRAKTLAASYSLRDLGGGKTVLARAALPDPCFWSPDSPALYQARVELRNGREVVQMVEQEIGLRNLGVRGRSFCWNSTRWVLRGIHAIAVDAAPFADWRNERATMVVESPSDAFLAETSRDGVLLAVRTGRLDIDEARRLARSASVGFVIPSRENAMTPVLRAAMPNIVILAASDQTAEAMLVDDRAIAAGGDQPLPQIAVRRLNGLHDFATARAAVDALQRDLATSGNFAGYIV